MHIGPARKTILNGEKSEEILPAPKTHFQKKDSVDKCKFEKNLNRKKLRNIEKRIKESRFKINFQKYT